MATPPESAGSTPRKKRSSGVVVPQQTRWHQRLGAWLIASSLRAVALTIRFQWRDNSGFFNQPNGPAIYCFWHNRLALCTAVYERFNKKVNPTQGVAGLVSASKDGAFLAAILTSFGAQPVRGSSSRRGPQALLELTTWAERGYDLAITPDGPRGPRYTVQEGVMALAQLTGFPIIPVSAHLSRKIALRTWDGFQIPLPFTRCEVRFEKPMRISRETTETERENLRKELEVRLKGD